MTKTIFACLILSTCFSAGCASNNTAEKFAGDDCKTLTTLFKDQSLNTSVTTQPFENDLQADKSQDKFTWPWGGSNEDKVSKERAAMRKAHSRKTCAQ